ncbi:uncharacterized protein LOC134207021 [Armigeres subalbatus]|uniref:uncharacterized protein LOC134207021 n=1 Tax=Armigeres subalbatus TaxID=124917 RepID=UPI002ED0D0EC
MSIGGKYVRAPEPHSDSEDEDEHISEWQQEAANHVKQEQLDECDVSSANETLGSDDDTDDNEDGNIEPREDRDMTLRGNQDYALRMDRMQSTLNKLLEHWNRDPGPSTSSGNIRWENIQPFPNDVPANQMWEQWNRFIDRFEIATSLSNVNDPAKRSQILFLSMGEKLQGIVRAARLRPSLREPNCYGIFVKSIENYLQSMVDITAEHEAFSNLRQEPDEPTITFHARLMEKVRLCRYSSADEDRFVRMQLLKGMRNKELAKTARTFGYETAFIVQSATREEAFEAEAGPSRSSQAFAVTRNRQTTYGDRFPRKRRFVPPGNHQIHAKHQRREDNNSYRGVGRRSRCPKCYRLYHKFGTCPANDRKCNACGETGHFAVACRTGRSKDANHIQEQKDHVPGWTDDENEKKQINALSLTDVLIECRIGSSHPIKFLIDSGADVNIIGGQDWVQLKRQFHAGKAVLQPIELSTINDLRAYASDKPISVKCAFKAEIEVVEHNKPLLTTEFLVVTEGRRSLLGRSTASDLRLLQVGAMVNTCEVVDVSEIFPKVPGVLVKFSVDETVPPVRNAYYNVPAAYRKSARERLQDMERRGIIERITTAPNWISGMSAVAKGKDDFRLVVNMRAPNQANKARVFPITAN